MQFVIRAIIPAYIELNNFHGKVLVFQFTKQYNPHAGIWEDNTDFTLMLNTEFFDKLSLLRRNEFALVKDVLAFVNKSDRYNSAYKCVLAESSAAYAKEEQNELKRFQRDLQKANDTIVLFKNELLQPKPDKIQHIKKVMESIESQMSTLKAYQKSIYDDLIVSDSALSAELALFDNDLHKYEKPLELNFPQRFSSVKSRTQTTNQHSLHPAIVEFDKFSSAHGPTNGWGEFEHQLFMKIYNSSLSDQEMLRKMSPALPFKSNDQIENQINWFRKFESLERAKRGALEEWRNAKNAKAAQNKQNNDKNMSDLEKVKSKRKELYEKDRQKRLAHLNAYKVQKELQRVMAEEEALKLKIAAEEKEAKRQQYVLKQKEKVQAYRERMKIEEEQRAADEHDQMVNDKASSSVSSSDLLRLHGKNMKAVEKKQQQKQEKIIAEFEQQQRLERMKLKVNVKRDPTRLFQKTKGQINREKDQSCSNNPIVGSRGMPHKAMPAWRKGL